MAKRVSQTTTASITRELLEAFEVARAEKHRAAMMKAGVALAKLHGKPITKAALEAAGVYGWTAQELCKFLSISYAADNDVEP